MLIPVRKSYVSQHLLHSLQQSIDDTFWNDDPHLLIWMLHMGGSFSPRGTIRSEYRELLQNQRATRFRGTYGSSEDLVENMRQFIWSEKAYCAQFIENKKEQQKKEKKARRGVYGPSYHCPRGASKPS